MSTDRGMSERAIRAAAATLVVLEGAGLDLGALIEPVGATREVQELHRVLCSGAREHRARALSTILTAMALDLDDWRLR